MTRAGGASAAIHSRAEDPSRRAPDPALRYFQGYGLCFASEIDLPWPGAASGGEPDVLIRSGAVPCSLKSPADQAACWQTAPEGVLLDVDGVARCLVSDSGRQVRVALARDGADLFACVLDSVLAACLQMRGILPLHASAVATAQGAVLLAGQVGSGKSTLAAALIDLGYSLLADGIVAVAPGDGGTPRALAGFPCLRLWTGAMRLLAPSWKDAAKAPVREGIESYAVEARRFHDAALGVHSAYVLARNYDDRPTIKPVDRVGAFAMLTKQTCRLSFLRGLGRSDSHFGAMTALVRQVEVARLEKPSPACPPAELADCVAKRLPPPCP